MDVTTQTLVNLATFIFVASVKGALMVALVLLLQRAAGRFLSAAARYLLWLPVIIALLTPIGVEMQFPSLWIPVTDTPTATAVSVANDRGRMQVPQGATHSSRIGAQMPGVSSQPLSDMQTRAAEASDSIAWSHVLANLWLAGVVLVLGATTVSSFRLFRIVRHAATAPDSLQHLLQECIARTACRTPVRLMGSAEIQVPMVAGLLRPVLLLPAGIEQQLTRAQLRHVFLHELMHLRRGDIACNWIVALVQALHWYNPVVWYAFFRMRFDRELACDAATLKHLEASERAGYGRTLLQLNDTLSQQPVPLVALGIVDATSHLQSRIRMLVQSTQYRKLQAVVAVGLFLPLAAAAFSQPVLRAAEPAMDAAATTTPTAVPEAATPPAPVDTADAPLPSARPPAPAIPAAPEEILAAEPAAAVRVAAGPVTVPAERTVATRAAEAIEPQRLNPALLAQAATASADDPFAKSATTGDVAAVTTPPSPAVETYADLPAIVQLVDTIAAAEPQGIAFIEEVETAAIECEAQGGGFFSVFTSSCTKQRAALRGGQIFRFGYQCFLLQSRQQELEERYRAATALQAGAAEAERLLRDAAENLADFCSKETYAARYPVFASMFADAESLKYFKPGPRMTPGWPSGITNERWFEHTRDWGDHVTGAGIGNINTAENWGAVSTSPPAFSGGMTGDGGGAAPSAPAAQ